MGLKVTGFRNDTEQPRLSGSIDDLTTNKCILGKKPRTLKLGEEPESAFSPIRLDDDYPRLKLVPVESYKIHGLKSKYVPLEKLAEKLRQIYEAIDAKPDWNFDYQLNIRKNCELIDLKKDFEITFYSEGETEKIMGTPHYKNGRVTGYNISVVPKTQVQTQLEELLKP